jgi:pimeloyl-ACP methyl ester carboxylesterase
MSVTKRFRHRLLWILLIGTVLLNTVAALHAYKFTHFTTDAAAKTKDPAQLSSGEKIKALLLGVSNPRPVNTHLPERPYETISIPSGKLQLEAWLIPADSPRGTVILFHGYGSEKSGMLLRAEQFLQLGYSTLLVDFPGSGGSDGMQTTIGFKEAGCVTDCYNYMRDKGEKRIVLMGSSMGAAAVMKAVSEQSLQPEAVVLECPFGTMYGTVCARFRTMHVPRVPMAGLLTFWGGVLNGFWAFDHNPQDYATGIHCPSLMLYGGMDDKVSAAETQGIYEGLAGVKQLKTFPHAGHDNCLLLYAEDWQQTVKGFLETNL